MLLKLQSYTMDVNKMLVDERIQVLSNIDDLDYDMVSKKKILYI